MRHIAVLLALALPLAACSGEPGNRAISAAFDAAFAQETRERRILTELGMEEFLPELESARKLRCQRLNPPADEARFRCQVELGVRQWGVSDRRVVEAVLVRTGEGWRVHDDERWLRAMLG